MSHIGTALTARWGGGNYPQEFSYEIHTTWMQNYRKGAERQKRQDAERKNELAKERGARSLQLHPGDHRIGAFLSLWEGAGQCGGGRTAETQSSASWEPVGNIVLLWAGCIRPCQPHDLKIGFPALVFPHRSNGHQQLLGHVCFLWGTMLKRFSARLCSHPVGSFPRPLRSLALSSYKAHGRFHCKRVLPERLERIQADNHIKCFILCLAQSYG